MMNEEIAEILLNIHMDDLRDAAMLADYAEEIKNAGDIGLAQAIAARAKTRLVQMQDDERSLGNVLARMKTDGDYCTDTVYKDLYHNYINAEEEKIHRKLEKM